jgi:hypothetical protein
MKAAKILSYLTHPILITTYLLLYVLFQKDSYLYYTITPSGRIFFILISVVLTIIAPLISVAYLVYSKQVTNFYLDHRKERIVPMAITVAYTFGLYYLLMKFSLSPIIMAIVGVSVVSVAMTLIITLFWKISAHMIGVAGFIGVVLALSNLTITVAPWIMLLLFSFMGAVGTARIKQDAHTLTQVLTGGLLGGVVSYVTLTYLVLY